MAPEGVRQARPVIDRTNPGSAAAIRIFSESDSQPVCREFCNLGEIVFTARAISEDDALADWWERGAPYRR